MPQYQDDWVDVTEGLDDWTDITPSTPEPTWTQWGISNILGTAPAIAGGIGGTLLGGPFGGAGLGMIGAGIGSELRQQYEIGQGLREERNPLLTTVEMGLGTLPGITKFPGVSAGAKELGKYALKTAGEGALIGGAATPLYTAAEQGDWTPTLEQVGWNALGGGIVGGTLGTAVPYGLGKIGARTKPIAGLEGTQLDLPLDMPPAQQKLPFGEPEPIYKQPRLPFEEPVQERLPFEGAAPPEFDTSGQGLLFGTKYEPTLPPPSAPTTDVTPDVSMPPVVTIKEPTPDLVAFYRSQGYESIKGMRSPEGYLQMVRKDVAPMYAEQQVAAPPPRPTVGGLEEGGIPATDIVQVPNERVNTTFVENMQESGYKLVNRDAAQSTFKRFMTEESGEFDLEKLVTGWQSLRDRLGRNPNIDEIEAEVASIRGRVAPVAGEQRGLVADFLPPSPKFPEGTWETPENLVPPDLIPPDLTIPPSIGPETFGPARTPSPYSMDPRMMERVEAGGPRTFDFTPQRGQLELPLGPRELRARAQLENIANAPYGEARMPEQLSMIPDFAVGRDFGPLSDAERMAIRAELESMQRPVPPSTLASEDISQAVRAEGGEERFGMGISNPREMIEVFRNTYAGGVPHTATKELIQNAIDAVAMNPNGEIDVTIDRNNNIIRVRDNGQGLTRDEIGTVFLDLSSSGKRGGEQKTIGELGVGKTTYLVAGDSVTAVSTARYPDGKLYTTEFTATPEEIMEFRLQPNTFEVPEGTPTGTTVEFKVPSGEDMRQASNFVTNFEKYSNTPNPIKVTEEIMDWRSPDYGKVTERVIQPNQPVSGKFIYNDSLPNTDYRISIPDNAKWGDRNEVALIIQNRGMFQGVDNTWITSQQLSLPDRILVELDPKVKGTDKQYPLTAPTRERLKDDVKGPITKKIKELLVTELETKRANELQQVFDSIAPTQGRSHIVHDVGGKYTEAELSRLNTSVVATKTYPIFKSIIDELNELFKVRVGDTGKVIKELGYITADGVRGMNVRSPGDRNQHLIMLNLPDILRHTSNPRIAADEFVHVAIHEYTHMLERSEGARFTSALADVYSQFDLERQLDARRKLVPIFERGYAGEVPQLLRDYIESRGRQATASDILTRSRESDYVTRTGQGGTPSSGRPDAEGIIGRLITEEQGATPVGETWEAVKGATGWGKGRTAKRDPKEFNFIREALAVPSAATTTMDFSAPGRQGLSMILTPQFWNAAGAMFKGLSPEGFKQIDNSLRTKPIFREHINPNTGKLEKSFAETIGMKLFRPASSAGPRAEAVASRWLETGGNIPYFSKAYAKTVGVPIRASNRAFITFLNHLNANRTEFLLNKAKDMSLEALTTGKARQGILPWKQSFTPEQAMELNPYRNLELAKEIADFVNTATGHGPLKTHVLPFKQFELNLEKYGSGLSKILFSPGLLASRIRMLNPNTYIMASPFVRKQYMKAALSTAGAWFAFTELAKLSGEEDMEISNDITSADFGKVRIGDTRMDPGGGFLQFLVAAGRLYNGGSTSSSSGEFHRFGTGYQAQTQEDMFERFFVNKLNPVAKFAYDLGSASEYNPFHVYDRTMQLFVPLVVQDVISLAEEDPELLPWMAPVMFGMGTQTYGKGESVGKLIDPERDWLVTGGGLRDLMPWNQEE